MKRCMRRGIVWVLCVLILALPAMAEGQEMKDGWICENCSYENLYMGRFCEECGAARTTGEWTCGVCGRINDRNFCEECGASRDATGTAAVPTDIPAPTPEAMHVLKSDIPAYETSTNLMVFGTDVERRDVRSITLLSSLEDASSDAIDVSEAGDGGVLLWFESDGGDMFDMFLGANGKMIAPESCEGLFKYYTHCKEIHLNDCLDTSQTTSMKNMFNGCWNLVELDGITFDTSKVTSMWFMFNGCTKLEKLDLSTFDTTAVQNFTCMFHGCGELKELDISSFEVADDARTSEMFEYCDVLPAAAYAHIADRLATPKPTAKPTVKPTATPYTYYPELSRGSRGNAVQELQERLIRLNYLAAGEADGSYGRRTAEAVHRFKENNGIADSGDHYATECVATSEMQNVLYGNGAKSNVEANFPLTFPYGSYAEWNKESGNKLKIRFQVTNISSWKTVTAFKIEAYATDVWGSDIYNNTVYYETTRREIAPSDYGWSAYLYLPDRDEIDTVYARISEVKLSDGTTLKNDDYGYGSWTITW